MTKADFGTRSNVIVVTIPDYAVQKPLELVSRTFGKA